jgi:hypothetical protein
MQDSGIGCALHGQRGTFMMTGAQPLHQTKRSVAEHYLMHEQLLVYATCIVQGMCPAEQYPELATHLAYCLICRSELEELLSVGRPVYTGELPQAITYPPADLSFLRLKQQLPQSPQALPWWVDIAGQLIILFSEPLLATLRPSPLVGSMRGRLLYDYIQESGTIPGLNARIEVFTVDQQPEMSCVRVYVEVLSRDLFDQQGSIVRIRTNALTWEAATDDTGTVAFEAIPLRMIPQLRIEITPAYTNAPSQ